MRGFTTVRDMGGPTFGLKRAIDEGLIAGPRIYPSGTVISPSGGHGDFRQLYELPRRVGGPLTRTEQIGGTMIADSPDEMRLRVREQLAPTNCDDRQNTCYISGRSLCVRRLSERKAAVIFPLDSICKIVKLHE